MHGRKHLLNLDNQVKYHTAVMKNEVILWKCFSVAGHEKTVRGDSFSEDAWVNAKLLIGLLAPWR